MDWQAQLQQFKDLNPDLPEGTEAVEPAQAPQRKPRLDIVLDRKGRAGKSATIVCGFGDESDDETITALAAKLKKRLATGGSVRGGEILVQGDRRKEVAELLKAEGYPCRII